MRIIPLSELFAQQLAELHMAETRLLRRLEQAMESFPPIELRNILLRCISETERYQRRLEVIASDYPLTDRGDHRPARIGDARRASPSRRPAGADGNGPRLSLQRGGRSEIPAYFFARHYARRLGDTRAAELLTQSIEEKHGTKRILQMVACGRLHLDDLVAA
jgi:ferritin-like metal-binding protein YciE